MRTANQALTIDQLSRKLSALSGLENIPPPSQGWLRTIRNALRMPLRVLARRMNISIQSVTEMERREAEGTISLNTLRAAAEAMNMKFVYVVLPKEGSLEEMIERQALELARKIVMRTSQNMRLEDQENTAERLEKAIAVQTEAIKREMPRYLWD